MNNSDIFLAIILSIPAFFFIKYFILPVFSARKMIRDLRDAGKSRAGSRTVDIVLKDIIHHDAEIKKCNAELLELMEIYNKSGGVENELSSTNKEKKSEQPKLVKIVFNSDEIGCKYKGIDVPKYLKDNKNKWFEFESLAHYDSQNRAIVEDAKSDYITIKDEILDCKFFYKKLKKEPKLLQENLDSSQESI